MISVVIPLYNEEDNISALQDQLDSALAGMDREIIFVDDGSTDQTLQRLQRRPGTRVLEFEKNSGQSAAMYAGIQAARGDVIVLLDGDLQNDPTDIPKLLAEIERAPTWCAVIASPGRISCRSGSLRDSRTLCGRDSPRTGFAIPGAL